MRIQVSPHSLTDAGTALRRVSQVIQAERQSMTRHSAAYTDDLPREVRIPVRGAEHDLALALDRITAGYDELATALDSVASLYSSVDRTVVR